MGSAEDTYLLLAAFVDELARCGMRAACTSPGSRCAPLVLALAREPRLRCYSHVDERCAGFFALGLAKATRLPVAVACTSGTAACELMPAATEAHEARVPLLLLTADRPAELRGNGAGQTIDQLKLFGAAAKWFFEVATADVGRHRVRWMRTLACRAYWTALESRPGVVHINFPLREPLVPAEPIGRDDSARPGGAPYARRVGDSIAAASAGVEQETAAALARLAARCRRGLVVAGHGERRAGAGRPALGAAAAQACAAIGWPLLADPQSGARRGASAIAHYDALLRDEELCASLRPDLVVRIGDLPVSKPLRSWLAGLGDARQVAIDPDGSWQDPAATLSDSLALDPLEALSSLSELRPATEDDWLARWQSADARAAEAILGVLGEDALGESAVAAELGVLLPQEATLFVASSMPVRDVETFWPARADPPRVLCNRGAAGIDGTVSSAFGAAAAGAGPVVALIGDVALAHDIGGLLAARRLELKLTIVLVNNGGGGIFDFLPVARAPEARANDLYRRHIATPTGLDFAQAAALFGLTHELAGDVFALRAALERALAAPGAAIVEVRAERAANVAAHERVWQAVSQALRA
jgi:2-succinyl-5-enolpyruvyl-6-hydroxy-3-cyclohexene-1-carboxylate synthase